MRGSGIALVAVLAAATLAFVPARAQDDEVKNVRGFVDGKPFLEFYDEDCGSLVEVSLPPSILALATALIPKDEGKDVSDLVAGLDWIGAVIVGLCEDDDRALERAGAMVGDFRRRLERGGWTWLTKIREQGSSVDVLVLNDAKSVSGVVVIVQDDDEIIFANVAGVVDMEKLARLGEQLDLPGLAHIDDEGGE